MVWGPNIPRIPMAPKLVEAVAVVAPQLAKIKDWGRSSGGQESKMLI